MTRRGDTLVVWENPVLQMQIAEPTRVDDAGNE